MTQKEINKLFKDTHFYIDIFGVNCHFIQNKEDYKIIEKYITKENTPLNVSGRCQWLTHESGEVRMLIGSFYNSNSTLAHECVHCGLYILEHIGQSLTYNDELLPYLVGLLIDECEKKIKR